MRCAEMCSRPQQLRVMRLRVDGGGGGGGWWSWSWCCLLGGIVAGEMAALIIEAW